MPIYEYKCTKCNKEFEYLVFGGDSSIYCPECNDQNVQRLMSACSFKSSGDYSSPSASSGCATCSSSNCSSCH